MQATIVSTAQIGHTFFSEGASQYMDQVSKTKLRGRLALRSTVSSTFSFSNPEMGALPNRAIGEGLDL